MPKDIEVLFFALSLLIVDSLVLLNRELLVAKPTAAKQIDGLLNIVNQEKFNFLKIYYDNN